MNGSLLDANAVSELTRDAPSPHVIGFLADNDDLRLSSIVIHELDHGLRLLPSGHRRESPLLDGREHRLHVPGPHPDA